MGKALESIIFKGIELKYINFDRERILPINHVTDEGIIVIISNEREKPYSSLKRILRNSDKFVTLKDTDKISKVGSKLIILSKKLLSPHASSEDIMLMINLMKPKYYFPIIGEYKDQVENALVAKMLNIPLDNIILNLNGEVATFIDGTLVDTMDKVPVEDILIDGKTAGDIWELVLKDREMLSDSGIVIVNANIDKKTRTIVNGPNILSKGFIYVKDNIDIIKEAENIVEDILKENIKENYIKPTLVIVVHEL